VTAREHRVVVVGGGFAGLYAVRGLRDAPVRVTLVDRANHHLFQPLLYQVATGSLTAGEIAPPLRWILRRQRNVVVVLAEVESLDLEQRSIVAHGADGHRHRLEYDTLIVAAGAETNYFGHDEWAAAAPGLKSIEDAVDIRGRVLGAFEAAELEADAAARDAWLTFVVVGGGPTGVELAGQIAELARDALRPDFQHIDTRRARVVLADAAPGVLTAYPPRLQAHAARDLRELGVEVRFGVKVTAVDEHGATLGDERLPSRTVIWAAGVRASPLAGQLAEATGTPQVGGGRLAVEADLTLRGRPEVFALGDLAAVEGVPGVAPAAMQMGRHAAATIAARLAGEPAPAFRYHDRGTLATIGRNRAVGVLKGRSLHGRVAWALWLGVHLTYLIGFQNRLLVCLRWGISYLTRGRNARVITRPRRRG
jgi:NADH dehydrogenase